MMGEQRGESVEGGMTGDDSQLLFKERISLLFLALCDSPEN